MQGKVSRRKLALYVVERSQNGQVPVSVLEEIAAYLVDTKRVRELELVVRSIEDELAAGGTVVATVTSARPLSAELKSAVERIINAKHVALNEVVDPSVLGGVRIDMPGKRLDTTIRRKLNTLRASKV